MITRILKFIPIVFLVLITSLLLFANDTFTLDSRIKSIPATTDSWIQHLFSTNKPIWQSPKHGVGPFISKTDSAIIGKNAVVIVGGLIARKFPELRTISIKSVVCEDRENDVAAYYDRSTVYLCPKWDNLPSAAQIAVLTHEVGHHYMKTMGLSTESAVTDIIWLALYNASIDSFSADGSINFRELAKISNRSGFVTMYAATSPSEDFAESFTLFVLHPALLRVLSEQRYNYFKDIHKESHK